MKTKGAIENRGKNNLTSIGERKTMETEILQRLYEKRSFEITVRNKTVRVQFIDAVKRREFFESMADAIKWLAEEDVRNRPESEFAKWWRERNAESLS